METLRPAPPVEDTRLEVEDTRLPLPEVEAIELLDKRGYLTICINLQREGKVYLRRTEGIRDWYNAIRDSMEESKVRRNNRASAIFADRRQNTDCSGMDGFVAGRRLGRLGAFSDSTPEVNKGDKERITLEASKRPTIESSHPWYSLLGIYHHYSAEVRPALSNQRPVIRSRDLY